LGGVQKQLYKKLNSSMGAHAARALRIVAVDCDHGHLQAVEALGLPGIKTMFGRLPDEFPSKEAVGGSASAILISEVLHFLHGKEIESSIQSAYDLLVPGGRLVLSTVSFNFKPFGNEAARSKMRSTYQANLVKGLKWPGSDGFDLNALCKDEIERTTTPEIKEAIARFPQYIHIIGPRELRQACVDAGFEIEVACLGDHPGYPAGFTARQKGEFESTHVVAVKRGSTNN